MGKPDATVYVERYQVEQVSSLPQTYPFRVNCMGVNYRPRPVAGNEPGCCWYHAQDWTAISELAIGLLQQAWDANLKESNSIEGFIWYELDKLNLDERRHVTISHLFSFSIRIGPPGPYGHRRDDVYSNGQHRVQAMKDLGVERTVARRWGIPLTEE